MNRFPLTSLLLLANLVSLAPAADVESLIREIRALYNTTENARLTQRAIKLGDGPETVELIKFYDLNGVLVKMSFASGGDHGFGTDYYYVNRGALYFVFQEQGSWGFDPAGPEGTTIDTSRERRVYYSGDQVIRHLLKEASSGNAEAVAGLLKKAENREVRDLEIEAGLLRNAQRLVLVDTEKELENFLHAE